MRRLPLLLVVLAACSSTVPPTNPYDPATPPEQQARAMLRGALALSGASSSAGVTMWIRQNGRLLKNVTTAVDGGFLFDSLVPGAYTLETAPSGFSPLSVPVSLRAGEDVDVGTLDLLALAASSVIVGVATLAGVDPLDHGGTLVEAVGRGYTAVTSSGGEFRLDVPAGDYDLRFSHASFVTVLSQGVTVAAGQRRDLEPVVLATNPATLVGHVDGELPGGGTGPLGDATVALEGTQLSTFTLAAPPGLGDFTLPGIPAGSYVVRVRADGYLPVDVPVFDLVGGKVRSVEPIVLSLARGGLAGAVTLSDSTDASGVVVEVAGTSKAVVTGSDGAFRFDALLAGSYALSARRDGYARKELGSWPVRADEVTAVTPAVLARQGGSVSVVEGAWVAAPAIHLAVVSGAGWYKASEDAAFADAPAWLPVPAGGPLPFTLADADGEHVVWVAFSADGVTAGTPASVPVVLDRQAPSSPAVVVGGGSGFTAAPGGIVSLSLSALDLPAVPGAAASGVEWMELSNDGAFAAPVRLAYALATTWTLAAPGQDGPKTVWARFVDRAGNPSAPASATVVLDTAPPASPSIALAGPPPSPPGTTTSPIVTVTLSAADANAGPAGSFLQVRLAGTPGFDGARWQPFAGALTWLLPPGDGPKTVWAQFMDPAGNESLPVSDSVVLDTTGPSSPAVLLAEQDSRPANGFTNVLTVDLSLSAQGGATAAKVSEDPSFTAGVKAVAMGGGATATTFTFGGSGLRTAWVRFEDAAGNVSAVAAASVTVDATPPAAVAPALVPAPITTGTAVQLVPPSAGQDEVQLAGDLSSPGPALWTAAPAGVPIPVILTTGDGPKLVTATWRDLADNVTSAPVVAVALDGTAPTTAPSFAVTGRLAGGTPSAALTATGAVTLDLSAVASDGPTGTGVAEMLLSNLPSLADASWQPFVASSAFPWTLAAGDGPKLVYARFRDRAQNASGVVSGSIALDTTGPTSPSVALAEQDAAYPANGVTGRTTVGLSLNAGGAPTVAQISEDPSFSTGVQAVTLGALPFPTSFTFAGAGLRTAWVRFFDAAGNASAPTAASVTVDQTPPSAVAPTLLEGAVTTSAIVHLVPPSAGQDEVQLAGVVAPTGWVAAPAGVAIAVTLPPGDGPKSIVATWRDLAENATVAPAVSITLDQAAPTAVGFAVAGTLGDGTPSATLAASTGITLDFSAVAADGASGSGVAEMQVSNLPSLADASWVPFIASSAVPWTLPPGDGPKTVYARFRDRAQNPSTTVTGTLTLRETPPSGGTVSIEGGATATSKASAALAISAVGATELQVVVSGTAGPWTPYGTTGSAPLTDPEGTKLVAVKFRNPARVEGGSASSAILYDHTAPPAPAVVVRGTLGNGGTSTVYASSNAVVVDVLGTSDAVELALVQSATCTFPGSPTWLPLSGASTFLLTGGDGAKTVCAKLRDRAGNVGPAGQASITLDTAPPSNPAFADLTTLTTNQAGVTGTLVASSVDPAPGTGVTYQCYASPASPAWTDCTPSGGNQLAFSLTANGPNVVGVRARDAAFNASTGTLVSVLQDAVKPFPPNVTQVRTTRDSLTLTWDPSADKDLAYFLVYYGGAAGDVSGTGAAQGPSPVQVAALGTGVQSYTLTGLTAGVPYYVAVEAIDRAGNRSGLSGQRSAVPNKVNPRVLSGVGGQPRSLATLTDAVSGRTFAYLAENQGVVQLDVTSEIASPRPIGRAFVSNVVPDTNAPPAVIPCTRGGAAGHCVILAGSTLEGDFRGDPDDYRAPAPVVYFPLTGTAADPALGEVETVLPALPHRVLAGAVGAQTVVFAVERGRVVAFDLSRTSFPVQLAEAALPTPLASVLAATLVGSELWVYGPWWANGISHEPTLEYVDVTDAPYGDLYAEDHGPLNDQLGQPLGSLTGYEDPHPLPAFGGGIYVLYTDFWSNGYVCGYDGWSPDPETCATFPMDTGDDGDQLVTAVAGNGHVYAFVRWGNSQGPYAYQFDAAGGSVSPAGTASSGLPVSSAAEAAFVGAYASSPVSTPEHLLAIDRDEATGAYTLQRFRVSGASVTVDPNSWREISPTFFAESDRFLFVSQGMNLDAVDVSNPLVPRPLAPTNRDANDVYGKLVVHGSLLFALAQNAVAGPGVEIFRIGGDGALTFVSRIGTTSTPHDLAVVGKWLLVGRATGIAAWSVADPAVPVAAGSIVTTPFEIRALDARPATSGSAWTAVVYAALDAALPGVVRTYGYAWNSVTPGSSTFTALSGAVALPPSNSRVQGIRVRGTTAAVSDANGTMLLSVANPAAPWVVTSLGGVTGPVLLQGGYVVGLASSVAPSGPLFDVYTGQAATSGAVDGSLFYSTCSDDGTGGSLVHSTGVYAASCRRNGITLFTAGDPGGGRLLKKFDVTDLWWPPSAALATDGLATTIGGAWAATPSSDWNRLWWADELQNAGGSPTAPTWSGALASKTANFLAHNDGLTWAVEDGGYATGPTLQAFEAASPAGAARVTFATAGGEATNAQPVASGDFLFLPRSASGVGAWSRVEAYDVRDPAAFGAPPASVSVVTSEGIGALALSRAKLYVGEQPVEYGAAGTSVHVFTVGATPSGGRSIPTFTRVTPIALGAGVQAVTGIAASGRWLFVTVQDAMPNAWELVVLKLDPGTRDGAGATVVARYPSSLPLANPVVSGDVLYASNNLGVASWDLGPLWRSGAPPSFLGGTANADPTRAGPVRFLVDGPFGYLVGGTYRAFDLR